MDENQPCVILEPRDRKEQQGNTEEKRERKAFHIKKQESESQSSHPKSWYVYGYKVFPKDLPPGHMLK